jgi:hypothetical protein
MSRALALLLILSASETVLAQDAEPQGNAQVRSRWQEAYTDIARSFEMRQAEKTLDLHDQPLLFYTNPVRTNDQHGTIFVWTAGGRAVVFGSIWSGVTPRTKAGVRNVSHEFHSLSPADDVAATRGGATLWTSGEPGIAWQTLADSPAPAASRAARLVQMRNLARRISGRIDSEEPSDLRIMSQPLYRYPEKVSGALDGALFAFSLATDPELVVLIEAGETNDKPSWQVAFARFGALPMSVQDGERTIWSCERVKPPLKTGRYYLVWRAEQMPADPQGAEEKR